MPDINEDAFYKESAIKKMSTDSLEETLRYSVLSDAEINVDQTRAVIAELRARENDVHVVSPGQAWKDFLENYSDEESSYIECSYQEEVSAQKSLPVKKAKGIRIIFKTGYVAAALLFVVAGMSMVSYATGYDLWGAVARWSQEVFSFTADSESAVPINVPTSPDNQTYEDMQSALTAYGITESVVPNQMLEGFELTSLEVTPFDESTIFVALYENGGDFL